MGVSALVMAMLLVATPALPQSASPPETTTEGAKTNGDATLVVVPEALQLAFDLMKQPGFHPELLELFDITDSVKNPMGTPAPALSTTQWVVIGVGIGLAALLVIAVATYLAWG